jgi:hypothetical protein
MEDLRPLLFVLESNDIHIRSRYIKSVANTWEDKLSRHLDSDDWQLDPTVFHEMASMYAPHTIDRFASALNTLRSAYNAN